MVVVILETKNEGQQSNNNMQCKNGENSLMKKFYNRAFSVRKNDWFSGRRELML